MRHSVRLRPFGLDLTAHERSSLMFFGGWRAGESAHD